MASKFWFFTGMAKWCKLDKPDERYGFYGLDLYLDKPSMKRFKESGLNLKIHKNDDGEYVRFRRDPEKLRDQDPEKPRKLIFEDGEYKPFDGLIGNGSFVEVKVQVYDSQKGKGHRLDAVAVHELVPYGQEEDEDLPF
jgi:hypothetical protein